MSSADETNACSRYSKAVYASADYFSTNDDPMFNNEGERLNAPVGSEAYFRGLVREMLAFSLANGVIVAPCEAQTVRMQYAQYVQSPGIQDPEDKMLRDKRQFEAIHKLYQYSQNSKGPQAYL